MRSNCLGTPSQRRSMPHNGSRISGDPRRRSFVEGTRIAARPHAGRATPRIVRCIRWLCGGREHHATCWILLMEQTGCRHRLLRVKKPNSTSRQLDFYPPRANFKNSTVDTGSIVAQAEDQLPTWRVVESNCLRELPAFRARGLGRSTAIVTRPNLIVIGWRKGATQAQN